MLKHADSHVDHGLTEAQLHYLLDRFTTCNAFFLETITLPEDLGTVPCGLWGPAMGDGPISESSVDYARRGDRAWRSRLVDRPTRPTRQVTVIAGPHDGSPCVLFTAFGGPPTPQEPGDLRRQLEALEAERPALGFRGDAHDALYAKIVALRAKWDTAVVFWRDHALSK